MGGQMSLTLLCVGGGIEAVGQRITAEWAQQSCACGAKLSHSQSCMGGTDSLGLRVVG